MLTANNISLNFGSRTLFRDVNMTFTKGNTYGLIGANGAGKSTFLKILSKEIEPTNGEIFIDKHERLSFLKQNHFAYEDEEVINTVIKGNERLSKILEEKNAIYMKADFSEADGIRAGELEAEFDELNGWQADSDAAILLSGLGIEIDLHHKLMKELKENDKVKVLLAQSLFGNPDILLLDEPTNGLDINAKMWLEEFLVNFDNTVIVVSHDRHFLNKVCTHMVDIDYEKITMFVGNYDFWYESSELIQKQMRDSNKKKEDKMKELQDFIARFSANASKSKQATSRKKSLEKIKLDEIKPSIRKYPYINFEPMRPLGKEVISVSNLNYTLNGEKVFDHLNLTFNTNDKVAFLGDNELVITAFFDILAGKVKPDSGEITIGTTVTMSYFDKNIDEAFQSNKNIIEWLTQYSKDTEETYVRGFLGRMLFSGEESLKSVNVLSGGEKVRCLLSKMMLEGANALILDDPTNHLDLESILSLNKAMESFPYCILFSSHDHELLKTVANRIIEFKQDGKVIDKLTDYDSYLNLKK